MNPFYLVRLALLSLRRNPVLSGFMVISLALGVSTWVAAHAGLVGALRNPLPGKPWLHTAGIDRPPRFVDRLAEVDYERFERGPRLELSYREYRRLAAAAPARAAATLTARVAVGDPPVVDDVRFAGRDLFSMFDLGLARGAVWSADDDARGAAVVIVDEDEARARWGDADPLGRTVAIAGEPFRVVGVLAGGPRAKTYDSIFPRRVTEGYFVPFEAFRRLEVRPTVVYPFAAHGPTFADLVGSDDAFIMLWLELADDAARAKLFAAGARPRSYAAYHGELYYLHPGYIILELFAKVILVASALNLVRLLLAKFMARVDQTGIQRALGASRFWIAAQHIVEAKMVGFGGGLLGLALGAAEIAMLNALVPDRIGDAAVDGTAVLVTVVLAIAIGLVAGLYPAWRVTRIPPAISLRRQ